MYPYLRIQTDSDSKDVVGTVGFAATLQGKGGNEGITQVRLLLMASIASILYV